VYAWGSNQSGGLGLGHTKIVKKPRLVKNLTGIKIKRVFCGCVPDMNQSFAVQGMSFE
jgi:alpha-tubulin suppressor-like RCC1 family protein